MDQINIVIKSIKALELPKIEIETSDNKKFICNLSEYSKVKCFPKTQGEWEDLSVTTHGFNITWGTRFEVHVLQAIDAAS